MVKHLKGSNILTLPHLSTAFPTAYNLSEHNPLILLFTDSQNEPDPQYDADVYMLRSLQLEYSICRNENETKTLIPNAPEQQHSLYRRLLLGRSERCRIAVICPIWWKKISLLPAQPQTNTWLTCGLDKSDLSHSLNHSHISISHFLSSSLRNHPAQTDIVNLAVHLLDSERNPYEDALPFDGVDGLLAVSTLNRQCCEFAIREATDQVGVFNTPGVRTRALDLIRGNREPRYNRTCPTTRPVDYANTTTIPEIAALGCQRWGNDSLTFFTVSSHNPPPWAHDLCGTKKKNLPRVAIIDSKAEIVYTMEDDLTYNNIAKFISRFHNGTLQRNLFSNSEPSAKKETNFMVAHSADQLQDLINQEAKDVIVLFYGRHCGYTTHGRGALYEFHSVARHLIRRHSLLFVIVDVHTVQLPWSLTVEHVPVVIFFPSNRKSNSIVFPQALLASTDLFSNFVAFVNKHATADTYTDDKRSNNSLKDDTFRMAEHLRVHLSRISSAEQLLDNLLHRLSTGLEDINCMIRRYSFNYIIISKSGRMFFDRLIFTRNRLSSQWNHFKEVQNRLFKERNATVVAKYQLNLKPLLNREL
ncbi:hypothetical protein Aperf_G00000011465 [Anoplocephala perfoliata]